MGNEAPTVMDGPSSRARPIHGVAGGGVIARVTVAALAALLGANIVRAQTLPNAGSELQQLQREHPKPLPPAAPPSFEPPPPLQSLGGVTVTINQFRFAGNTLMTDRRLSRVVSSFLHRPLDFAQLQNAAIAVADAYRKAGRVVRAYLPQQDVTEGTATIQIIEATFGSVHVNGHSKRISTGRLTDMVQDVQHPDTPVNADALDRALLLINDLPGVSVAGRLAEGAQRTQTDLLLDVKDHDFLTGQVSVDNYGERFTGAARISAQCSLNSPFGIGDRADGMLLESQGSNFASLAYSLPVGDRGWRVGVNASYLSYRIITGEFTLLDAHGSAINAGIDTSYPLIRTRLSNLYFSVDLVDKRFYNASDDATTSQYWLRAASASLYGNLFDAIGAGGSNTASLTFEQGLLDLAGSPNETADAMATDAAGAFHKLSFALSRLQALTKSLGLYVSASGQVTDRNLDSSEKLYLGGSNGVRAYPVNEGGGSDGLMLNFEARARLPMGFAATGFFDWGDVRVNERNDIAGSASPNTIELKGAGVSASWVARFGLSVRITVAHRIGSNPDPTSTGTDQDGSLIMNRIWAQVSMPF
jgi:hemolysin activation/secretion protein